MKHRRERVVVDYEPRTAENSAFLCYYPKDEGLSFQWTGSPTDPIEVCRDEQVVAVVTTRAGADTPLGPELTDYFKQISANVMPNMYAQVVTHWFQHICNEWINHLATGGDEPQWVTVSHG